MAASTVPAPGAKYGPCTKRTPSGRDTGKVDPFCGHIDCRESRETASSVCGLCHECIGYDTRYYRDPAWSEALRLYVHAVCLENHVDAERSK